MARHPQNRAERRLIRELVCKRREKLDDTYRNSGRWNKWHPYKCNIPMCRFCGSDLKQLLRGAIRQRLKGNGRKSLSGMRSKYIRQLDTQGPYIEDIIS